MSLVRRSVAAPPPDARLADVVDHWSNVLDGDVYLVLDQLEEYFVYHDESALPGRLVDELPEVVLRPRLRAHVVLSLRDDALARLDVFKARIPNVFANYLRLDPLDHAAATAAIVGPIRRWNELVPEEQRVDIEPALVERVLAQAAVAEEPGRVEPPYLQLVMERLWNEERERGSHMLRASTLDELGGAGAIVREHLDRALSVLDAGQQDAASRMFEHLVTPSGTKVAHRAADLARFARLPEAEAGTMIAALRRERILRPVDESNDTGPRYEIFHDVLADAILGWCGRREVEAERARAQRRHRRLVALSIVALAAVLVMAAITIFALAQRSDARSQARSAQARALAAAALTELDIDPEMSLMLARQSCRAERVARGRGRAPAGTSGVARSRGVEARVSGRRRRVRAGWTTRGRRHRRRSRCGARSFERPCAAVVPRSRPPGPSRRERSVRARLRLRCAAATPVGRGRTDEIPRDPAGESRVVLAGRTARPDGRRRLEASVVGDRDGSTQACVRCGWCRRGSDLTGRSDGRGRRPRAHGQGVRRRDGPPGCVAAGAECRNEARLRPRKPAARRRGCRQEGSAAERPHTRAARHVHRSCRTDHRRLLQPARNARGDGEHRRDRSRLACRRRTRRRFSSATSCT